MQQRWIRPAHAALLGVATALAFFCTATATSAQDDSKPIEMTDLGLAALIFVSEQDIFDPETNEYIPFLNAVLLGHVAAPVRDDAGPYNPFKGSVTYSQEAVDTISISDTFAVALNPGDSVIEIPYTAETLTGSAGRLHSEPPGSAMLPPAFPPGISYSFDSFATALVESMGLNASDPTTLTNGAEVNVVWPEGFGLAPPTSDPIYIIGSRTVAPRPFECPGLLRETGFIFDTPVQNWDDSTGANSTVFNDFFYSADTAFVTGCENGPGTQAPTIRVFQGPDANPKFSTEPSMNVLIQGPYGSLQIVSGAEIPGAVSIRWFDFVTDLMAPYDRDYTAASAFPSDLTTLHPLSTISHIFYDESLLAPPSTTTTMPASTTTIAASATPSSVAVTSTTQAAVGTLDDPASTSGGFPYPLLIFAGLVLMAIGSYVWRNTWQNAPAGAPADAVAEAAVGTTPEVTAPAHDENPPPTGSRTYSAEDREFLNEIYKGADDAGVKIAGISEITRLEDALAGSKADPVVIGKATTILVRVGADGSLLPRRGDSDEAAASVLQLDVIPGVEFDSDGEAHVVWNAYAKDVDATTGRILDSSKSGPSSAEWEAKVDGRPDHVVGNDPDFKDWIVESMPNSPGEAVRRALSERG